MKFQRSLMVGALIAGAIGPAGAFPPDGCEQQRAQYPANWSDTAREKPLFTCSSHYNGPYRVKIGASDSAGRTMMSLVPLSQPDLVEQRTGVLRIWLDKEQAQRLRTGKYFATVLRNEKSCWIRGDLAGDTVFFMDNVDPPADQPEDAGSFYNKAPRFSFFANEAYDCEPAK
jgi:hypothetical protein